ncbi:tetratricopeptide repeat protein [Occallatibacter riparius]|uniref:Sel1 repeat family protein n=1 Tax=Occallatibacter riparius TaxID=1002689 RepID=A0A9J7BHP0_9BACT|nr:tetratricopeptide repeat protein [Occallatibacter riparius]UWZ82231.1 sel1 repeat family protein [Occallatibacter riparius]
MNDLRKRAEQGYPEQQLELAKAYLMGKGVPQDLEKAAHWYEMAARRGNPEAENQIAYFYQKGIGVPTDPVRAFHWYQLASASGLVWAKVNLGVSYLYGMGVPKNASTARHLFQEAVGNGNGLAAAYLGHMDYFGLGGPVDKAAADKWFVIGSKLHDPIAAYSLGLLYSEYDDHSKDNHRAAELFRFSARKGYILAKHELGRLLVNHPELAKSPQEARTLLLEASGAGLWNSSAVLGALARDGIGEPADAGHAYYWFFLSKLQGGAIAEKVVARDVSVLEQELPDRELAKLSKEAQDRFGQQPKAVMFLSQLGDDGGVQLRVPVILDSTGKTTGD